MLRAERKKIFAFARKYAFIFALGILGWEISHYMRGDGGFGLDDALEAVGIFVALLVIVTVAVSIFRGWIDFQSESE